MNKTNAISHGGTETQRGNPDCVGFAADGQSEINGAYRGKSTKSQTMSDPKVDSWRQHGRILFWRDSRQVRNFPGWNLSADEQGLGSLLILLSCMHQARWTAQATMHVHAPDQSDFDLPVDEGSILNPAEFTLKYPVGKVTDTHWAWAGTSKHPVLTIGSAKLSQWQDAVKRLATGADDFCVHAEEQSKHDSDPRRLSIWFWSLG